MKWLSEEDILFFLQQRDYDVRKSGNARWIDQKCAPDVVTIVSDCIANHAEMCQSESFTSKDIWHDPYTVENVESFFKKPDPDERKARHEYDKFFQQPMEMLSYAGILRKRKVGNRNTYSVENHELLNFLALREKNSLLFLQTYIEKVLRDSGIFPVFEAFLQGPALDTYAAIKMAFKEFTIANTPINGKVECFRIFIKVLNPLAFKYNTQGTAFGRLSKHKITRDMLAYNRNNFRDIYAQKPKELTRKQYAEQMGTDARNSYFAYTSRRAKRELRVFNDTHRNGCTEVLDGRHMDDNATHMHHIFPEAAYSDISGYLENLIALTPTQHLNYAHPNGRTTDIDRDYQRVCLLAKSDRIREELKNSRDDKVYDFENFMLVLSIGLKSRAFKEIAPMDFDSVIREINLCYG